MLRLKLAALRAALRITDFQHLRALYAESPLGVLLADLQHCTQRHARFVNDPDFAAADAARAGHAECLLVLSRPRGGTRRQRAWWLRHCANTECARILLQRETGAQYKSLLGDAWIGAALYGDLELMRYLEVRKPPTTRVLFQLLERGDVSLIKPMVWLFDGATVSDAFVNRLKTAALRGGVASARFALRQWPELCARFGWTLGWGPPPSFEDHAHCVAFMRLLHELRASGGLTFALYTAFRFGCEDCVQLALELDPRPNWYYVCLACYLGLPRCLELLLSAGSELAEAALCAPMRRTTCSIGRITSPDWRSAWSARASCCAQAARLPTGCG